jgi:hypothetical protein
LAIVTNVGAGSGGRDSVVAPDIAGRASACERSAARDERCSCVRRSRVVLAPVAGVKSAEVLSVLTGIAKSSIRR